MLNCYNIFHLDKHNRLEARQKKQELLRGAFGTVYADTEYSYQNTEDSYPKPIAFSVRSYANSAHHESPLELQQGPDSSSLQLSAISIVRIFEASPEYLVISADYSTKGDLIRMSVNGARDGDWVHSNEVEKFYPDLFLMGGNQEQKKREFLGIPQHFPIETYLVDRASPFASTSFRGSLDIVNLHYNRNFWVKQIRYDPNGKINLVWLSFKKTADDEVL